jgi:hypothetical protein
MERIDKKQKPQEKPIRADLDKVKPTESDSGTGLDPDAGSERKAHLRQWVKRTRRYPDSVGAGFTL